MLDVLLDALKDSFFALIVILLFNILISFIDKHLDIFKFNNDDASTLNNEIEFCSRFNYFILSDLNSIFLISFEI